MAMTRMQFIMELTKRLKKLPKDDREKVLEYYLELIDDRIDDGVPEEEAVAAVGSIDEITTQILGDIPLAKLAKDSLKTKNFEPSILILMIISFPIWFSILISLYAMTLAVVLSFAVISIVLGVCTLVALLCGIQHLFIDGFALSLFFFGSALICAGLFMFFRILGQCTAKGGKWVSKKFWLWIKSLFLQKEAS